MRSAAVLAVALFATGCSLSAGPVLVSAPSLGFKSPYFGATVQADVGGERFIGRAEASALDSQKIQTGDGYGVSALGLAGTKLGRFRVLGGARWNAYYTSLYDKDSSQWLAEAGYAFRSGGILSGTYSLETDGSGWDSYGLRCEVPMKRIRLVSTWEHLRFEDQAGAPVQGDRISLAALWKFK